MEFGVKPLSVKFYRGYTIKFKDNANTEDAFLVDYKMPDGEEGRGFVGMTTFSFSSPKTLQMKDHDLLKAYVGMVQVMMYCQDADSELNREKFDELSNLLASNTLSAPL
jgi:hypothetical protein